MSSLQLVEHPLLVPAPVTVRPGQTIGECLPADWQGRRVVCRYNGRYILRAGWACPVQQGDVVEFHELVEGDNALRTVLQIAALAIAIWNPAGYGAAIALAINVGVSLFLPIDQARANTDSPSPTYNVQLAGNSPRLGQAIPVIYGRHLVKPDFAGDGPYFTYEDNDQYLHVVYCVGQGRYTIEQALIGRTLLGGYQDVLVARQLEPGELPQDVLLNVVTSRDVGGQDMPSGLYIGGFAVCSPGRQVGGIGVDFLFPRGLGNYDSGGNLDPRALTWRVETRRIDDFGNSLSSWSLLASETETAASSTPLRVSRFYTLTTPGRYECRVVRTDIRSDSQRALNDIQWIGLRGHLTDEPTLCPTATHYELKIRASEQLSAATQNQFGLVVQRLLRVWSPEDGWSEPGDEVATRNPFRALMDAWTNSDYVTDALADDRVDLATLHALALQADERQDRFDYVFDQQIPGWDAASLIARAGRAQPFRRNGVHTCARDELQELPVTAFGSRSIEPGSYSANFTFPSRTTPDGIIAEYFDFRVWDWLDIECPAPGYTVTNPDSPRYEPGLPMMSKPVRRRYPGITGPTHCEREGLFDATIPIYRREAAQWTVEMQGTLPAFGCAVKLAPALPNMLQDGDVAFWNAATRTATLTEPPRWTEGAVHYLQLQRDDGSMTGLIRVEPGAAPNDVVLEALPDFTLVLNDGTRERPKYLFGDSTVHAQITRVVSIDHQGPDEEGIQLYMLTGQTDDERVHARDNFLLPGPGEIQDAVVPGNPVEGGGGGDVIVIVDMPANLDLQSIGSGAQAGLRFRPDGSIWFRSNAGTWVETRPGSPSTTTPRYWQRFPPIETEIAEQFEVMFQVISPLDEDGQPVAPETLEGDALGVWLGLGVNREIYVPAPTSDSSYRIRIRTTDGNVVQDTMTARLFVFSL